MWLVNFSWFDTVRTELLPKLSIIWKMLRTFRPSRGLESLCFNSILCRKIWTQIPNLLMSLMSVEVLNSKFNLFLLICHLFCVCVCLYFALTSKLLLNYWTTFKYLAMARLKAISMERECVICASIVFAMTPRSRKRRWKWH